ncbi:hypothetical protein COK72_24420, partial [Bacillus thuringiensis]
EELKNDEYRYHFLILKEFCQCLKAESVEQIMLESFSYFEKENLIEYICEYAEKLAIEFHKEGNIEQAEKYFYKTYEIRRKIFDKGALK